ncbi:hypothetical protein UK23_10640 [Lentzea aerocolonigenes]|uniref:Asparagine synthetase domain-containing protein n=1 Tax=Lentzea aerocolonigenes TaxID=68170 RepID=A0A0F0H408_LENAE|nr:hypothetical protein UK23_10640 [Lentzea aerocolonigenes]
MLPYSDLDAVLVPDEPTTFAANAARTTWWLRRIAGLKSDVHLSGEGGDAVLMALPSYLGDLASRSVRQLWSHALGWAKLRNLPSHALVRAGLALRGTSYSDALRTLAVQLVTSESTPRGWATLVTWLGSSRTVDWLTPEARALVASKLHEYAGVAVGPVVPGRFGIGDSTSWLSLIGFGRGQRLYADTAARLGVNHHAPYLDNEVIRSCWSAAAWIRTTPERAKPLLAEAVADLVPASLVQRTTKGDYSGLAYRGLKRNADFLHDLFTNSELAACGLVDEEAVRWTIDTGVAGLSIPLGAFDELVSTELWLRAQRSRPASQPRPKEGHLARTR